MQSRAPCVGHARPLTHHKGTGTPWVSVGRNLALWPWVRPALLGVQPRLRESSCNRGLTGAVELSCNRGLGAHATTTSRGNSSKQTGVETLTVWGNSFRITVTHATVWVQITKTRVKGSNELAMIRPERPALFMPRNGWTLGRPEGCVGPLVRSPWGHGAFAPF